MSTAEGREVYRLEAKWEENDVKILERRRSPVPKASTKLINMKIFLKSQFFLNAQAFGIRWTGMLGAAIVQYMM